MTPFHLLLCAGIFVFTLNNFKVLAKQYTPKEQEAIQQLRVAIGNGRPYEAQYKTFMKTDQFLYRYVKDRNFEIDEARKKLIQTLKWRKEERIDGIVAEKLGDMDKLFPYELGKGFDLEGNPLLTVPYGRWDVRRFMVRGNGRERMKRHSAQLFERCSVSTLQHNATWVVVILNMNAYNVRQHGCAACIPMYFDLLGQYEMYYAGGAKAFNFINTPRAWEEVLRLLLPILSSQTKEIVKIYGYNKADWQKELLKTINPNQLSSQYGGTGKS